MSEFIKNRIPKAEQNFINRMGKISKKWGMSEPAGRVWATLLISNRPLSQKEIAQKTGYTLSLVSPSLTLIEGLNMVKSCRKRNKEKLYEVRMSFLEGFRGLIRRFLEQDIKPLIEDLEHTREYGKNKAVSRLISEYKVVQDHLDRFEKDGCRKDLCRVKI